MTKDKFPSPDIFGPIDQLQYQNLFSLQTLRLLRHPTSLCAVNYRVNYWITLTPHILVP